MSEIDQIRDGFEEPVYPRDESKVSVQDIEVDEDPEGYDDGLNAREYTVTLAILSPIGTTFEDADRLLNEVNFPDIDGREPFGLHFQFTPEGTLEIRFTMVKEVPRE